MSQCGEWLALSSAIFLFGGHDQIVAIFQEVAGCQDALRDWNNMLCIANLASKYSILFIFVVVLLLFHLASSTASSSTSATVVVWPFWWSQSFVWLLHHHQILILAGIYMHAIHGSSIYPAKWTAFLPASQPACLLSLALLLHEFYMKCNLVWCWWCRCWGYGINLRTTLPMWVCAAWC